MHFPNLRSFLTVPKVFSLIFILSFLSCGHIEHSADVVKEEKVTTPVSEVLNKTRNQILQNKNALRIAFLKLEWGVKESKEKNKSIVLDSGILAFMGRERSQWDQLALARLHGQLVPELYQLLRLVEEKGLKLMVICINKMTCDILKQNLSNKSLSQIQFLDRNNLEVLKGTRPYLVISSNERIFDSLANEKKWLHWQRQWVKVERVEYSSLLGPDDLARVVPTVHEF